jgi:hypothetical protein
MTQFIAYENTNKATNKTYPYLLDIRNRPVSTVLSPPLNCMKLA